MIQSRKISEVFHRGKVVGSRCVNLVRKKAKVYLLSVYVNMSNPFTGWFMPRYALKSRRIVLSDLLVSSILYIRTGAEVCAAIIKSIPISVIYVASGSGYKAVHENKPVFPRRSPFNSRSIASCSFSGCDYKPVPAHQSRILHSVNDGDLPFGQRNTSDKLVKRLNNRLAVHATFGHDLTSHESAAFSRFCIVAQGRT